MIKFSDMLNESLEGSSAKFKLGLDIHGVVDSMPEFFSFLTDSFIKNGGEVHIITGGQWNEDFESLLNNLGVKWTHKFSVYDHLIETGSTIIGEIQFPDGTIQKKFENGAWDDVKANYCRENNISLHIDDTLIYNNFFTTPFARLWTHTNNPKSTHKDVRHMD
jgi:hypothetical protein